MKKAKRFTARSIVITAALSVLCTLGAVALAAWLLLGTSGLAVAEGAALINLAFVGEYDEVETADAALEAMVASLGDRWSYYADAEDYEAMQLRQDNAYVGIGITVTYEADGLHIQSVTEGGPAEQAGLRAGEIITAVDDTVLNAENVTSGAALIRGEVGAQVVLTVLDAQGNSRQVTVTRARLSNDPVTYKLLDGNIGYVALDNFYDGSADHVKGAVEALQEQGAQSLIFDMRGNPGGFIRELTDLLDYLLPEGNIFSSGNASGPKRYIKSDADCVELPMAVLVNANSYSAAELFAAQLRESVGAPIIGQPTYGKGYSQQTFWLPGNRGLNISTRTYYTGAGVSLIGVGITPDKVVELTGDGDAQLDAAIALMRP